MLQFGKKTSKSAVGQKNNTPIINSTVIPHTENCVFALNLDKERNKEHVLIGELRNVQKYLLGYDADLLVNESRPLGTLLKEFPEKIDDSSGFYHACMVLHQYPPSYFYNGGFNESLHYLEEAALSLNLAERFVAIRLIQEKNKQLMNEEIDYDNLFQIIAWPFLFESSAKDAFEQWQRIKHTKGNLRSIFPHSIKEILDHQMSTFTLYSANAKSATAYQAADISLLPLLLWYIVFSSKEYYRQCKNCGEYFLVLNKGEELCSDACKKNQWRIRKAHFDEKAKETKYEPAYRGAYMYWYNRLKKIRSNASVTKDEIEFLESEFKEFCNMAKERKKIVKANSTKFNEFNAWLLSQEGYADTLMKKYLN